MAVTVAWCSGAPDASSDSNTSAARFHCQGQLCVRAGVDSVRPCHAFGRPSGSCAGPYKSLQNWKGG
eukprot:243826-Chlamydomonas_euryale.AAC.9